MEKPNLFVYNKTMKEYKETQHSLIYKSNSIFPFTVLVTKTVYQDTTMDRSTVPTI